MMTNGQTNKQTNKQTNGQTTSVNCLSKQGGKYIYLLMIPNQYFNIFEHTLDAHTNWL